jgi:hypothetical protein
MTGMLVKSYRLYILMMFKKDSGALASVGAIMADKKMTKK